jgi:hypothetical protein
MHTPLHTLVKTLGLSGALCCTILAADCCTGSPNSGNSSAAHGEDIGPLSGNLGLNISTAYYNRGVLQNRHGLNFQPYGNLQLKAFEGDGPVSRVDFQLGTWVNLTDANSRMANGKVWSEIDFLPGVSVKLGNFTVTETLQIALFPDNNVVNNFLGLETKVAFDDRDALGAFALNPTFTHLASLSGGAGFGMGSGGHFWHFGVSPSVSVGGAKVSLPMGLGLSSGEFYRTAKNGYGFTSIGLATEVKLPFQTEAGNWKLNASITYFDFSRENTGNPAATDLVGRVGIGVSF